MSYAALWCKSNFSLLEGASHPEELIATAAQHGVRALALTDRHGVYGVVRAHQAARAAGLQLIIGCELTLAGEPLLLLVENRHGYGQLCQLLTRALGGAAAATQADAAAADDATAETIDDDDLAQPRKGTWTLTLADVAQHAQGLLALAPSPRLPLAALREAFADRLRLVITRHCRETDGAVETELRHIAARLAIPLVASHEVLYHEASRRPLQDVLTALRHRTTLATAGRLLRPNAEHALLSPAAMATRFADAPGLLAATLDVAQRCQFSLAELRYRYPEEALPQGQSTQGRLAALTWEGARGRYGGAVPDDVRAQLGRELALVAELDYGGYFLTMWELVQFCRANHILCQGRGSAANSIVCYCLGITAVDPVRMGLLFERFISRERAEPPDIDLDIEHERREEVIQHVYQRYGRSHAAMVANIICYRPRSALRDVGRVLGLAEPELARLANQLTVSGFYAELPTPPTPDAATSAAATTAPQATAPAASAFPPLLLALAHALIGFPRHVGIHPGGFLLGHEPLATLVPIEPASMAGRTVIQWNKDDVEALGLFKVDLLGLGALTHLHRCFDLLAAQRGLALTLANIPPDDAATYAALGRADTVGVFQIESRAQMAMLPRLRPRTYYDLVIEISLVRPGPITGGMVHPYLRRRDGLEPITYPHPCLEPILKKTLGVPLFQEQVMKLAMVAADYTPGEADQLRRDMGAWKRTGSMEGHRERLITRMQAKGIAPEFAERVFAQICGFGEYGFPESHAASFALISYAGAYLKTHYPVEFACALLNSLPMGFYSAATIIEDAKRHGVVFRPVCVQASQWECTLEPLPQGGHAIRMGLTFIKGLAYREAAKLIVMRPYHTMAELAQRAALPADVLVRLSKAGACDGLALAAPPAPATMSDYRTTHTNPPAPDTTRRHRLWAAQGLGAAPPAALPSEDATTPRLPTLSQLERLHWDYAATAHSTEAHPLVPLRAEMQRRGLPSAAQLAAQPHGRRLRYAGLVICRQHPGTAGGVTFMTLEDETGFVNVVLWRPVFMAHMVLAKTQNFLGVTGTLQHQHNVVHLIAEALWQPELSLPIATSSRDFH